MELQYVPFGRRAPPGAVACDGLVPGARLDLSHWARNRTPAHLKADTSVEIALRFLEERSDHDVSIVTNNHFDTDGVLAVWTLLSPANARRHADTIVAAAVAGDFDEWPSSDRGLMLDFAIASLAAGLDDARAYRQVVPALDDLIDRIDAREDLFGPAYQSLLDRGLDIERGRIGIERAGRVAVIHHGGGVEELPGPWIARHVGPGVDRVLLAFETGGGFDYRYELPRWAWADTVVRPKLRAPRRGPIRRSLGAAWTIKGKRGLVGLAFTAHPICERPLDVAERLAALES
jgi:hypothetical protein